MRRFERRTCERRRNRATTTQQPSGRKLFTPEGVPSPALVIIYIDHAAKKLLTRIDGLPLVLLSWLGRAALSARALAALFQHERRHSPLGVAHERDAGLHSAEIELVGRSRP